MPQTERSTATLTAGFQWKPEWRTQLPFVRGVHAPEMETLHALLARVPTLRGDTATQADMLARLFGKPAWLSSKLAPELIQQAAQGSSDAHFWLNLMVYSVCSEVTDYDARGRSQGMDHVEKSRAKFGYDRPLDWVVRVCLARHGLVFTFDVVLALLAVSVSNPYGYERYAWINELLGPLRQAIACATNDDYQEAFAHASAARHASADASRVCAHLFAHHSEWAQEWLAAHSESAADRPEYLLKDCVLPAEVFALYTLQKPDLLVTTRVPQRSKLSTLLLQIYLHPHALAQTISPWLTHAIKYDDKAALNLVLDVLVRWQAPTMLALLLSCMALPKVRTVLEKLATQFPAAVLKAAIEHTLAGRNRAAELWTIRLALQHPKALPDALAVLEPPTRKRFEGLWATLHRETAAPENLPPLLREPPWLRADRPGELPTFDVVVLATPAVLVWPEVLVHTYGGVTHTQSTLEQAAQYTPTPSPWLGTEQEELRFARDDWGFPKSLGLKTEAAQRLLAGQALEPGDMDPEPGCDLDSILLAPPAAHLALWNSYPSHGSRDWKASYVITALLARYGTAAFPGAIAFLTTHDGKEPWLAARVDSPGLVNHMTHGLRNVRLHKESSGNWIARFPRTVLFKALPQAFASEHSAPRDDARHAITWLVERGHADLAREVADTYGGAMPAALHALLTTDPIFLLPGVMPQLPDFFVATSFRRPELLSGGALPVEALEHIGRMLALEQPGVPYAGISIVKQSCTRASLAEFAWIFTRRGMAHSGPTNTNGPLPAWACWVTTTPRGNCSPASTSGLPTTPCVPAPPKPCTCCGSSAATWR